jgi:hypothetical protein
MHHGLTDPVTMLAFSAMPIQELCEQHRRMVAALRHADHWHRLIGARIDLAVAAVTEMDDLRSPAPAGTYAFAGAPPEGLRELVGMGGSDRRLHDSTLLTQLRTAMCALDGYRDELRAVTGEAAVVIAERVGSVRVAV